MELSSSKTTTDLQVSRKWKGRDRHHHQTSPRRTKVWAEPNNNNNKSATSTAAAVSNRKVPVVYYLSRNGQLEHPHFMDVPLSSPDGLCLKDVIDRLNHLRGKGMASMYSWSSKRSYKNGFVWHDLSEDDFIHPAHGQEYVLKGSEIVDHPSSLTAKHHEMVSSFRVLESGDNESADFPVVPRRRNQSWSSIDLNEYKVYKAESNSESFRRLAADASTQTDDKRRRRRVIKVDEEEEEQQQKCHSPAMYDSQTTELSREEISPPPSDSSPETLESLIKANGRLIPRQSSDDNKSTNHDTSNQTADNHPSGRMKASTVLLQLISCGSISMKDCGPVPAKDQGFSLVGHYKARVPRGTGGDKKEAGADREIPDSMRVKLEDKEYFSGSLIETNKKEEVPSSSLKRSNSCNADRSSQLQLAAEEVVAKCMATPRKPKAVMAKRESGGSDNSGRRIGNKGLEGAVSLTTATK